MAVSTLKSRSLSTCVTTRASLSSGQKSGDLVTHTATIVRYEREHRPQQLPGVCRGRAIEGVKPGVSAGDSRVQRRRQVVAGASAAWGDNRSDFGRDFQAGQWIESVEASDRICRGRGFVAVRVCLRSRVC